MPLGVNALSGLYENAGNGIKADNNGHLLLTGYFGGPDASTIGIDTIQLTSKKSTDILFARMDTAGHIYWAKSIGNVGSDAGRNVSFDDAGNCYLSGVFQINIFILTLPG